FSNGLDECQMLCMNFFCATARQACKSCRHDEFDLVAKAPQEMLQLDRVRSFSNRGMKIDRLAEEAWIGVPCRGDCSLIQVFGFLPQLRHEGGGRLFSGPACGNSFERGSDRIDLRDLFRGWPADNGRPVKASDHQPFPLE